MRKAQAQEAAEQERLWPSGDAVDSCEDVRTTARRRKGSHEVNMGEATQRDVDRRLARDPSPCLLDGLSLK